MRRIFEDKGQLCECCWYSKILIFSVSRLIFRNFVVIVSFLELLQQQLFNGEMIITFFIPLISLSQRMIGGFTKKHFTRFQSDFNCILIRLLSCVVFMCENFDKSFFNFLWLGYPPGMKKNFLSPIFVFLLLFDRVRCADHENLVFIEN